MVNHRTLANGQQFKSNPFYKEYIYFRNLNVKTNYIYILEN